MAHDQTAQTPRKLRAGHRPDREDGVTAPREGIRIACLKAQLLQLEDVETRVQAVRAALFPDERAHHASIALKYSHPIIEATDGPPQAFLSDGRVINLLTGAKTLQP